MHCLRPGEDCLPLVRDFSAREVQVVPKTGGKDDGEVVKVAREHRCELCGRDDFSSLDSVINHIKTQHVGKLSDGSIEYLLRLGVSPKRIVEFCRENGIKVDERKVYRIAVKLVRGG